MNLFLDVNILVAVLCNEYPLYTFCSRILTLADNPKFKVHTSPLCLGIAFYFTEKKNGTTLAKKKITLLSEKLHITEMNNYTVKQTIDNKSINDFEDGLEYYSAKQSKCMCIVTEDKNDFYFSEIEILNAEEFLRKYVSPILIQ